MTIWDRLLDPFRGKAVTIPPLDGAFKPNAAFDEAEAILACPAPDSLASAGDRLLVASGRTVLEWPASGGAPRPVRHFAAEITALATFADGGFVAGLDDGSLHIVGGAADGRSWPHVGPQALRCPTAIAILSPSIILVCQGSASNPPSAWARDLMEKRASGSLWRVDLSDGTETLLAADLAWPAGIQVTPDHSIVVSEAWRHRLIRILADGRGREAPVLDSLPGYPGRLAAAAGGGAWLSLFAPRNRLVEFVLGEDGYRRQMLATIPQERWIAPSLSSGASFLEPQQSGAIVTMGVRKPWAPSRSYGLAARLDAQLQPVSSLHSRANGARHGITSVIEHGGRVLAASKGGNIVLDAGESHR